jgi:hypothetical protein
VPIWRDYGAEMTPDLFSLRWRPASYIAPLNPDADEFRKVPKGWIPRHETEGEEREGKKRLRRYFRQLGFGRVGRTRFFGLSLSQMTPTLADLIRPVPG